MRAIQMSKVEPNAITRAKAKLAIDENSAMNQSVSASLGRDHILGFFANHKGATVVARIDHSKASGIARISS